MFGLQGKSAKPTQRTSSFPKSNRNNNSGIGINKSGTGTTSPNITMSAPGSANSKLRASSIASALVGGGNNEKPEKLSRTSPYNSKMSSAGAATGSTLSKRRVQSAVVATSTNRQGAALEGPSIKASELFRKNSEPQLTKPSSISKRGITHHPRLSKNDHHSLPSFSSSQPSNNVVKTVKHVRIDIDDNYHDDDDEDEYGDTTFPLNTFINSRSSPTNLPSNFLREQHRNQRGNIGLSSGIGSISANELRKRPFSFSSDRSKSVSMTSVNSNDSSSTTNDNVTDFRPSSIATALEHHGIMAGVGGGDADSVRPYYDSNNTYHYTTNQGLSGSRTTPGDGVERSNQRHQRSSSAHPPRLSKRAYSMDSSTLETGFDNLLISPRGLPSNLIEMEISEQPEESLKEENVVSGRGSSLVRTRMGSARKSSSATEKTKAELNRTFTEDDRPMIRPGTVVMDRSKSLEFDRLLLQQSDSILEGVSDLIDDIKASEADANKSSKPVSRSASFEDSNKSLSSSRIMRGSTIGDRFNLNCMDASENELVSDIACPQQVMDQSVPNSSRDMQGSSSIAEIFMDALSAIQMLHNNDSNSNNDQSDPRRTGRRSSSCPVSDFEVDADEIQKKICSALKLLEEEDKRVRKRRESSLSQQQGSPSRSRSLSPEIVSNSESRGDSRAEDQQDRDSCSSSPKPHRLSAHTAAGRGRRSSGGTKVNCRKSSYIPTSARSCSCIVNASHHKSSESLQDSPRSCKTIDLIPHHGHFQNYTPGIIATPANSFVSLVDRKEGCGDGIYQNQHFQQQASSCEPEGKLDVKDDKTKQIFSFLDEVEKTDQEILFGLRFEKDDLGRPRTVGSSGPSTAIRRETSNNLGQSGYSSAQTQGKSNDVGFRTMDVLIRKGSVELAREILLLERKLDEAQHAVKLLEESLINQRELNIRNLRNSERDFKKRMKMQKEEFELAFSRNESLINEMAAEKRVLQEKLDKILKNFEEMEEKHKEQTKSMQQKHLDEIRRLRKMQQSAENSLKQKIAGTKQQTQEIREMTVKGLEPEVQRIIQRHQQEMSEMRAWHADEVREIEERCQRKLHMQLEDMREKFGKEKEDAIMRERELANRRLDADLKQKDDEIESVKRRFTNELFEERERSVSEELKLKEAMQEAIRKAELKGEVELENLKKEYEGKISILEKRYENELKSVKDVYEAEKQNWMLNHTKKMENVISEQEVKLRESFKAETEREWREKERKLKEDFEKFRKDDESSSENRFRRMQEKLQQELSEMESIEKDVKTKLTQAKSELLTKEEELFSLKASMTMKDKQLVDLQEMNMKMQEERVNLTSVIRREFSSQIQTVEDECRSLKASIVEIQASTKLQIEQKQLEMEKIIAEKDAEIEKIGLRVKQALGRKDETILELQKQLEKCSFQINHLEELLEEQRKELLHSVKMPGSKKNNK